VFTKEVNIVGFKAEVSDKEVIQIWFPEFYDIPAQFPISSISTD
jgi:hypothetical protein